MTERPHKRLRVWQTAMEVTRNVYEATEPFPRSELFGLVAQLRRAAVSVPANVAEGAARQSVKERLQFYYIARASLSELDTLVELSVQLQFLRQSDYLAISGIIAEVSSLLQGLIVHQQHR